MKKIKTVIKIQIEAGKANPAPSSLRSSLKPLGLSNSATGKLPFSRPLSLGAGF
jgi:ribosomal protein L11